MTSVNSYLPPAAAFVPEAFALLAPICVASGASSLRYSLSLRPFASPLDLQSKKQRQRNNPYLCKS